MTEDPVSYGGARVPDQDSQHGVAVMCARCRKIIDLSKPLAVEGWQAVHHCADHVIEALAIKAGSLPWAWRARDGKSSG